MEHATPPATTGGAEFLNGKVGIALLMIASSIGGGWIKDRLATESRDNGSAVRIESLEKRLDGLQTGALTAVQFNEFRLANDQKLEGIRQDIRDLIGEVNSDRTANKR
jgi:hypothetical protein